MLHIRLLVVQSLVTNNACTNPDFRHKFADVIVNSNCAGQLSIVGQAVVVANGSLSSTHDSLSDADVLHHGLYHYLRMARRAIVSIIGKM